MTEPSGISDKLPVTSDVLMRAREALEGTTPGPWRLPATLLGIKNGTVFADDNDSDTTYQVAIIASTRGDADGRLIAAAPQLVADLAAEVEQLRAWRSEALTVTAGLQDLGKALGVPLGHRITGLVATKRAQELVVERDRLRATIDRVRELADDIANGCLSCGSPSGGDNLADTILRALDGEAQ